MGKYFLHGEKVVKHDTRGVNSNPPLLFGDKNVTSKLVMHNPLQTK
jgi:hypothetical protein